ncbi:MAG TPA: glycerol-3-phosphate dehydrogenase/oxidase, partial [Pyrinomonadaceae bacterium]|nr:glycerol-3-phosphate dehydrogenase/oxidase [Pyrinomonadaceae bacterium]
PVASEFDVIIIGAGINGAGIARDAAMRGLKVLLIDKGDIGSGTSAASTRLIHGGLRYLEQFEFGLVRESLTERETLLRIAPHLVRPLPITIPIYKQARRGRTTIRAGLIAYDLLSWGKSLPRHRMQSARATLKQLPGLEPEGLVGSAVYYDAQVEFAERLVLENVLAAAEAGATVRTYTRVTKLVTAEGRVTGVHVDTDQTDEIKANFVINAAGPWVDQLQDQRLIGGTKGSHIVVAPFPGAPERAVYLEAISDGRPFFVIPWNGNYLIGTTDVGYEDDPDRVCSEQWEVDYLLAETNRAFPDAGLAREQVLYTYSGVRPLPFTTNEDAPDITRRHFLRQHPRFKNLISVVGGKLTTYRSLAEECVDQIVGNSQSRTAKIPLPGAVDFIGVDPCDRLQRIYGSRANQVVELAKMLGEPNTFSAEIVFAFEHEFAQILSDCFLRRTMIGLNADRGLSEIQAAADVGKRFLGWTEERAVREVECYRTEISRMVCNASH